MSDRWRSPPPFAMSSDEAMATDVDQPGIVLLVDDDPMVREVLTEALSEYGYRVIAFRDGDECLRALPPAGQRVVLVTDVGLPGVSGRVLADEFRRRCPGQPVVFVTGMAPDTVGRVNRDEIVLLKPFRMQEIAAVIGRALARPAGSA